jgi:hypothetical protein
MYLKRLFRELRTSHYRCIPIAILLNALINAVAKHSSEISTSPKCSLRGRPRQVRTSDLRASAVPCRHAPLARGRGEVLGHLPSREAVQFSIRSATPLQHFWAVNTIVTQTFFGMKDYRKNSTDPRVAPLGDLLSNRGLRFLNF